ncbi:hypothetical protein C8F04DRAFT_1180842 [Mycena alexandri]|uniref:Uncharacterized protein n=1 Tax=Mycena alexandri TaxID=1745969 RepID=A0AAD6T0J8_9AGAR|nr:hypothetical protein C8F04DRAFT_1180842 [Mycena alexandri]
MAELDLALNLTARLPFTLPLTSLELFDFIFIQARAFSRCLNLLLTTPPPVSDSRLCPSGTTDIEWHSSATPQAHSIVSPGHSSREVEVLQPSREALCSGRRSLQLLESQDPCHSMGPDERSVMTYIGSFHEAETVSRHVKKLLTALIEIQTNWAGTRY